MNMLGSSEKSAGRLDYRWIIVIVGFIINLFLGAIYSYSIFRKPLERLWGITSTESGLPYTVFLAAFAFFMPLAGSFLERFGPRSTLILGSLLVATGWILSGYSTNIYVLTVLYGLLGGAGTGTVYSVPITTAAKWFPEKAGTAIGLTVLGFGLSPLITAPIITSLIELVGPLRTFLYIGIAILPILLAFSFLLRFPQQYAHKSDSSGSQNREAQIELDRSGMLRTRFFYALWLAYAIGCLSGFTAIGITAPFGIEIMHIDQTASSMAVSLFAIFNGLGRPLFGWLTDKLRPRAASMISFGMIASASSLLYFFSAGNLIVFYLGFAVLWLNLGGWLAIAPTSTKVFFGTKNYGKNYGIVITADGAGAILGPVISGWLRDSTGTYLSVLPLIASLALIGLLIVYVGFKQEKY
ncbi:MAG: OFA family MFS transporter [Nitrososphaerota archaeon]